VKAHDKAKLPGTGFGTDTGTGNGTDTGTLGTTDFSTMKVRGRANNKKAAEFVPQFAELLQKSDTEAKVNKLKYEAMDLKDLANILDTLDKKLTTEMEELKMFYEQDTAVLNKILSVR